MTPTGLARQSRTLEWAHVFVNEVRREIEKAARDGDDVPPRLRCIHERQGHATPEYRTLAIPIPDGVGGASPEVLSLAVARFSRARSASCLVLAFDAVMQAGDGQAAPVLIAEVRDRIGTRFFLMQPFTKNGAGVVEWGEPFEGGWREPGDEEMILDAAFRG